MITMTITMTSTSTSTKKHEETFWIRSSHDEPQAHPFGEGDAALAGLATQGFPVLDCGARVHGATWSEACVVECGQIVGVA